MVNLFLVLRRQHFAITTKRRRTEMVASLGMVGAAQGLASAAVPKHTNINRNNYKDHTFDQLVTTITLLQASIEDLNRLNSFQAAQIGRLNDHIDGLKMSGVTGIANGRSPIEVKLTDENEALRRDLKQAREQLTSIKTMLSDFENTPVATPTHELDNWLKQLRAEGHQREEDRQRIWREEERQRARRAHKDRIKRDIDNWLISKRFKADEPRDPSEFAPQAMMSPEFRQQLTGIDEKLQSVEDFINAIKPMGC